MVFFSCDYQLYVNPILEVMVPSDLCCLSLPSGKKFGDKHHEVRIAHGNRDPLYLAGGQLDGEFIADLGLSHVHLEGKTLGLARDQPASLHACPGSDCHLALSLLGSKKSGDATSPITRNFSFGPVGIEQADAHVGFIAGIWK